MKPLKKDPRIRHLELVATRLVDDVLAGTYRSMFRGRGVEFDEVREYVDGDSARLIDWNVSSRLGGAYTKMYREERELTLFLIVDTSSSLYYGSGTHPGIELASSILSLFSLAAQRNNDKVGAVLFGDGVTRWYPPRKDTKHIFSLMLGLLNMPRTRSTSNLAAALGVVNQSLKRRGICVIVSDFLASGYEKDFALLAQRHDVIAIRLLDPIMRKMPLMGTIPVYDPESNIPMHLFTTSLRFRARMREYWASHREYCVRLCQKHHASLLEIFTDTDPIEALVQYFKRRRER